MPAEWKKRDLKELIDSLERYPVVGVIDFHKVPSQPIQRLRKSLAGEAKIKTSRATILKKALTSCSKPGIEDLSKKLKGQSALIFSKIDAFRLNRKIAKLEQQAKAKPGDRATDEIVIPKGKTELSPGPAIGKLQRQGIKTKVKEGKIMIQEDTQVANKGDIISKKLADVLSILDLKPLKISLELEAAWEDEAIYSKEDLAIKDEEWLDRFKSSFIKATRLSISASYPTSRTMESLLQIAFAKARRLGLKAEIPEPEIIEEQIRLARRTADLIGK